MARRTKKVAADSQAKASGAAAGAQAQPREPQSHAAQSRAAQPREAKARVLLVAANRTLRMRLASRLAEMSDLFECVQVDSALGARTLSGTTRFDVALIADELADGRGVDLARELSSSPARPVPILITEQPTLDSAVEALRCGAADLLSAHPSPVELQTSVLSALDRCRQIRHREARIERLTRVCRKLNEQRREVTQHISSLCGDMVNAYQELADQVTHLGTASEFNSLIRQELDVESALRTGLEYILAKTGPTNAAIFLPGNSGDFSLGAYVNYDIPKDALDMQLDHLTSVVSARMEREHEMQVLSGQAELESFFGPDGHWLGDTNVVAFACHHEGECLAVAVLFRDCRSPFQASLVETLRTVSHLFGRQLARVVHVHHRHLPKDQWGGFSPGDDDDIDLAA